MGTNRKNRITFRSYDHNKDARATLDVFKEINWVEHDSDKGVDAAVTAYCRASHGWVAELRGNAESMAFTAPGNLRYQRENLELCAVTGVLTSTIARRLSCATRVTAEAIADAAEAGAQVAALGVFEQGFYERLGFGVGSYEHWFDFDPATLRVGRPSRPAHRLRAKDWKTVHESILSRMRGHGSCNVLQPELTRFEMAGNSNGFGFGYYDGKQLTHHVWLSNQGGEHGPVVVHWTAFRTYDQFLELLSLLKSIGDQFHLLKMREPPGVQLQDFLDRPFKYQRMTKQARFEHRARAAAYQQVRIMDLNGCIEKTHLPGPALSFNLELSDPIGELLPQRSGWNGVQGSYTVRLGEQSSVKPGKEDRLPTLRADVGAFTRMWMGFQGASTLSLTGGVAAPEQLIEGLDRIFRLPQPHIDWDF